jgi:hypothetical protein
VIMRKPLQTRETGVNLEQQLSPGEVISEAQANTTGQESIMAISKRTRFEVLRRDNHTCRYCRSIENPLTVDHVLPTTLGGTDNPDNLVACCKDCNAGKSSTSPDQALVADVAADAIRWSRAVQAVALIRSAAREERDAYVNVVGEHWNGWTWGPESKHFPRPGGWKQTLWRMHELGLPPGEITDAMDIACANNKIDLDDTWRYMCGIAWKRLTAIQEMARQQLEWIEEGPAEGA